MHDYLVAQYARKGEANSRFAEATAGLVPAEPWLGARQGQLVACLHAHNCTQRT